MTSLTFHCEVVTPMFLGGANPNEVELRPPSIKGALRFWWRALYPDPANYDQMLKEENELFGCADEKIGRSEFQLLVKKQPDDFENSFWNYYPDEWRINQRRGKKEFINGTGDGRAFLLYSMFMLNDRPFIAPKSKFTFEIRVNQATSFNQLLPAIQAWVIFGGLGSRTRRGAGAFRIKDIDSKIADDKLIKKAKAILLFETIGNNKVGLEEKINSITTANTMRPTPKHTSVFRCQSKVLASENSWEEALEALGRPFKNFRTNNKHFAKEMAEAFGLPVLHSSTRDTVVGKKNDFDRKPLDRRSSPWFFKVIKVSDDTYFPCLFYFDGQFLPNGYRVYWKKNGVVTAQSGAPLLPNDLFNLY